MVVKFELMKRDGVIELPPREQRPFASSSSCCLGSRGGLTQGNTVFNGTLAWDMTTESVKR